MKSIVTILLLYIAVSQTKAQSVSLLPDTFTVSAQLVEEPGMIIACGVIAFQFILKFDTPKTVFNAEHLNVIVQCPDFYGQGFFEKGKHYQLNLSKNISATKVFMLLDIPKHYDKKAWFMLVDAVKLD